MVVTRTSADTGRAAEKLTTAAASSVVRIAVARGATFVIEAISLV